MQPPRSGGSFPPFHSFQIPLRLAALAGLSVNGEWAPQHNASILMIVTGGSGIIAVDGHTHILSCGSLLCSSSARDLSLSPQYSLQGVWIEYAAAHLQPIEVNPLNCGMLLDECTPKACTLASRLLTIWNESAAYNPFSVQLLFSELLSEVYAAKTERLQLPAHWLDRVLQYIEANYNEDLTRGQMAELARVSPEHFSRTFRKATGHTFNAYLTLKRIRRVQQRMLTTGTPNLSTLAQEVGYGEGTYLSRKFKQVVGLSPTAFHRKNKRIASLNFNHTASLRALEITPEFGVYSGWMEELDLVPAYSELRSEGRSGAALYHSVAAARPDVIISYLLPGEGKQLLPIAPVIELPFMQMDWREQFRIIAAVADRQPQAEVWLNRHDELCYSANLELDRLMGRRGTAVVWEVGEATAYCYSSRFGHGCQVVYDDLGFRPPAALVDKGLLDNGYLEVAVEHIADYPADVIIITSCPSSPQGQRRFNTLLQSTRWRTLDAARNGLVFQLDQPEKFYGFDPLSSLAQLKTLMQTIRSQIYMGRNHNKP